ALESLESKADKFHPNVPLPKGENGPTGRNEVLRRGPDGRVQALWVGEGKPHGEAHKLLVEPQPEVGAPGTGAMPTGGEAGPCYGCSPLGQCPPPRRQRPVAREQYPHHYPPNRRRRDSHGIRYGTSASLGTMSARRSAAHATLTGFGMSCTLNIGLS